VEVEASNSDQPHLSADRSHIKLVRPAPVFPLQCTIFSESCCGIAQGRSPPQAIEVPTHSATKAAVPPQVLCFWAPEGKKRLLPCVFSSRNQPWLLHLHHDSCHLKAKLVPPLPASDPELDSIAIILQDLLAHPARSLLLLCSQAGQRCRFVRQTSRMCFRLPFSQAKGHQLSFQVCKVQDC
jgi:hypothetical protein